MNRTALVAMLLLGAATARAQELDPTRTVLPIHTLAIKESKLVLHQSIQIKYATGFCVDPDCKFVGTNYHVALGMAKTYPKIKGVKAIKLYLATGPTDEGAQDNYSADGKIEPEKYTASKDLAIYEMKYPLKGYHGLEYSLEELDEGQEVDVYAYPKTSINPMRTMIHVHGKFIAESVNHLLAFSYEPTPAGRQVKPGSSGGLVIDSKTHKVVGLVNSMAMDGSLVVFAVPVQSLATWLKTIQPFLHEQLFPTDGKFVPPAGADLYPPYISDAHTSGKRPVDPPNVQTLRDRASALTEDIRNFIAIQSYTWGVNTKTFSYQTQYEIRVTDGTQHFRPLDSKKEYHEPPEPPINTYMTSAGEWYHLPAVATNAPHFHVRQAADTDVNELSFHIFQWFADAEDQVCGIKESTDYGFYVKSKELWVACHGEIWTDQEFNIVRMTENDDPYDKWTEYRSVVTFGIWKEPNTGDHRIPLTITAQAKFDGKVYWCRGLFTDYKLFTVRVRIGPPVK